MVNSILDCICSLVLLSPVVHGESNRCKTIFLIVSSSITKCVESVRNALRVTGVIQFINDKITSGGKSCQRTNVHELLN